ncbi:MAG: 4Fe-4S binding protein [Bacillota bacterium]|nr:4Fe-4S binding protein [Bacillota bacterium]
MIEIKNTCPGCGLCVPVCPTKALAVKGARAVVTGQCVDCGFCRAICPVKAIVDTPPAPKKGVKKSADQ